MDFKDIWDIVKTVLTLSVILLPVIWKLIGKSLKSAGKVEQKKIHDVLEPFYGKKDEDEDEDEDDDEEEDEDETLDEAEIPGGAQPVPESVQRPYADRPVPDILPVVQPPAELLEGNCKSIKDIVRERQEARKTDEKDIAVKELDIDPKKLVIYSEIMNTKF